jgi:hypothetical protein
MIFSEDYDTVGLRFGYRYEFDPDLPPTHEKNQKAANERGLVFNSMTETYNDSLDCQVLDKFGNPLGWTQDSR